MVKRYRITTEGQTILRFETDLWDPESRVLSSGQATPFFVGGCLVSSWRRGELDEETRAQDVAGVLLKWREHETGSLLSPGAAWSVSDDGEDPAAGDRRS